MSCTHLNPVVADVLIELASLGHRPTQVYLAMTAFNLEDVSDAMFKRLLPWLCVDAADLMPHALDELVTP